MKIVQAAHHQGHIRYGASRSIQCSCMSLISVSWTLFEAPGLWDKLWDVDSTLGKGDKLFEFIGKFRWLGMEDLPQEFWIKNCFINVEFLENKTGEIAVGACLQSIAEIKNSVLQIGASALLIVNNHILCLIWGNDSTVYLFDAHSKDENGNLSSSSTAILLNFDTLHSLENYVKSVYFIFLLNLYFQVQFMNIALQSPTLQALFNLTRFCTYCIFNTIDFINLSKCLTEMPDLYLGGN